MVDNSQEELSALRHIHALTNKVEIAKLEHKWKFQRKKKS